MYLLVLSLMSYMDFIDAFAAGSSQQRCAAPGVHLSQHKDGQAAVAPRATQCWWFYVHTMVSLQC